VEEHAIWYVDVEKLRKDLSIAADQDQTTWNWSQMRSILEGVFSNPSPETKRYLALIRRPESDAEATRHLVEHFRDDLPRWFQVAIAPALSPADSIARYPSLLPPMLVASGWEHADAVALLVGDPLAGLAAEIGLPLIASQLAETPTPGWLATDRVATLNSSLNATLGNPTKAVRAAVTASAAYWTENEAEKAASDVLNDARIILERASRERRPLRVVYDA
jgi:hypothetical protein